MYAFTFEFFSRRPIAARPAARRRQAPGRGQTLLASMKLCLAQPEQI